MISSNVQLLMGVVNVMTLHPTIPSMKHLFLWLLRLEALCILGLFLFQGEQICVMRIGLTVLPFHRHMH
jgi:hypothetical protein